jgi:hypothetical protein
LKQKAPFPPQPAVHFSWHDAAWAKVELERTTAAMMVTPIMNDLRMIVLSKDFEGVSEAP